MISRTSSFVAARLLTVLAGSLLVIGGCNKQDCVDGSGELRTEERQVASFHSIVMEGSVDVVLSQGGQSVGITGDNNILPLITTTVVDGVLTISSEECYTTSHSITATIVVPDLQFARIHGSGDINASSFTVSKLRLEVAGSGDIQFNELATDNLALRVNGSGDITVAGNRGQALEAEVKGSGGITADEFPVQNCTAAVDGSGEIRVATSESLDAKISGSGDIYYKGDPGTLDATTSGSGEVIRAIASKGAKIRENH